MHDASEESRGRHFAGGGILQLSSAGGRWVLLATVLGSAMTIIDSTVVGIALPTIGREFHASIGALQWVLSGYSLTLGALLLVGGSLGDRFGRRRLFQIGTVWFVLSSASCALAPGATSLVMLRILQGVGAALLTPGSLAILQASFVKEDRSRVVGAWTGLGGVASAAGPLLGGYLISAASWRWIFLINVPIGLLVLALAARHVPESKDPEAQHTDALGAVLGVLALGAFTFGLIQGPTDGWGSATTLGALFLGLGAGVLFVAVERRALQPMVPLGFFRERRFTVTNTVTFFIYAALGGALFLLPVDLQVVGHYSALQSGLALLPLTVIMLVLSAPSGQLASRIGPRLQLTVGPLIVGGGLALLSRAGGDPSYPSSVLPAMVVFALGLATTVAPLTATALGAVPEEHAGLASAVNNVVARVGGLLAVAVLPAIAGISGSTYLHPSQLGSGFRTASLVAAAWCALGGLLAGVGLRGAGRPAAPTEPLGPPGGARIHCGLDAPRLAPEG